VNIIQIRLAMGICAKVRNLSAKPAIRARMIVTASGGDGHEERE
jgi:hypothetical protein